MPLFKRFSIYMSDVLHKLLLFLMFVLGTILYVFVAQCYVLTCYLLSDAHQMVCECKASISSDTPSDVAPEALPRLKIWVENSMYHTFNHNIWKCIMCWWQQIGVSEEQHDGLVWKFTWLLWFCIKWPTTFCFWHRRKMAYIQEIQEYLWKDLIFHNYSLQVELQTMPPLLQDFGNPVPNMLRRDLRRFYAFL